MPRSIIVCQTCRLTETHRENEDGKTGGQLLTEELEQAIERMGSDVKIRKQDCLWNCSDFCNVVLSDDKKYSYLAGRFQPVPEQAEAIVEWFEKHGESEEGAVRFKEWPQAMKGHFIARIPRADLAAEEAEDASQPPV